MLSFHYYKSFLEIGSPGTLFWHVITQDSKNTVRYWLRMWSSKMVISNLCNTETNCTEFLLHDMVENKMQMKTQGDEWVKGLVVAQNYNNCVVFSKIFSKPTAVQMLLEHHFSFSFKKKKIFEILPSLWGWNYFLDSWQRQKIHKSQQLFSWWKNLSEMIRTSGKALK